MKRVRTMKRLSYLGPVLAGLLTLWSGPAGAGAPTEQLRGSIDKVIKILENPALRSDAKTKERRAAIRQVAEQVFDFSESAKRALARHWQDRTDQEREEFIGLFGDLLERSYISKLERYGGEKIAYTGESVEGDQATVRTKVVTKQGVETPVEYRLLRRGERWRVYDVSFEGLSLISTYRTQFNKIIQGSSYRELVQKLKTKQEEFQPRRERS